ncbi:hypothetical protein AWZ03_006210 [Drosophila navojoa]|uniref:Uncharacterized protein n=1 Tax=Drosophila navojoa TaxID=7232 RepID=A0A484BHW2_DRONA|nr:hypothetical protein AWZ03_006210 [Drosophila navojoa]
MCPCEMLAAPALSQQPTGSITYPSAMLCCADSCAAGCGGLHQLTLNAAAAAALFLLFEMSFAITDLRSQHGPTNN